MTSITVNGNTYTWPNDFAQYGFQTKWPALLNDSVADFAAKQSAAAASASSAASSAAVAQNAATTATMSTATQAASTTSLTLGTGTQVLTVQTGKGFLAGMPVRIADSDGSANYMDGVVAGYNGTTGTLTVTVSAYTGSGTFASWNVFLEGVPAELPAQTGGAGKVLASNGASAAWVSGGGGATVTNSMSTNLVLTASSTLLQTVNPTASGLAIQLPDATTMEALGQAFVLKNIGPWPVQILNNGGSLIGFVAPGQTMPVMLEANGTANGTWRLASGDRSQDNGLVWHSGFGSYDGTIGTATSLITCQLDAQYGIAIFYNGTDVVAYGYQVTDGLVELGATGTTIVAGANFANAGSAKSYDICRNTSTEAFLIYAFGTTTYCQTLDLNTSTLAVTANAVAQLSGTYASTGISCAPISAGTIFATMNPNGTLQSYIITIASGVCTAASEGNFTSGSNSFARSAVLSPTLAHVITGSGLAGNDASVIRVVLNGTSAPAPGTAVSLTNRSVMLNAGAIVATGASASFTLVHANVGGPYYAEVLTDTGSSITVTETQVGGSPSLATNIPFNKAASFSSSSGAIALFYQIAGGNEYSGFFEVTHPNGTSASMSGALPPPPWLSGAQAQNSNMVPVVKTYDGIGAFPYQVSTTTGQIVFAPFGLA